MKTLTIAAGALAASLVCGAGAAQAQGKTITLRWAAWDPANALVELSKDFTAKSGVNMKFEFVPWPNFADRFLNELNSKGKLCDLIIDCSGSAGRPRTALREAQRLLRQGRHPDGRLPARHRLRLFDLAQGRAELLRASGHGRRARLDLPEGLVLPPDLQAEFKQKHNRDLAAEDLDRIEAGRGVLPEPADRRQECLRRGDLHRPRFRGHHHGRDGGALFLGVPRRSEEALRDGRLHQFQGDAVEALEFYKSSTSAARRPATPTPTCRRGSTPSSPGRWRCR